MSCRVSRLWRSCHVMPCLVMPQALADVAQVAVSSLQAGRPQQRCRLHQGQCRGGPCKTTHFKGMLDMLSQAHPPG
jgi:hypothetical protein